MTIDELNEDLIVLGSQGKILKLDIDKKNLSLRDEIQVNNFCQTICLSKNNYVVRHRLKIDESDSTKSHKNIVMYDTMNGTPKRAVGDVHSIHNWLITREFSKGEIFCSDDNIYSFDWYVPRLLIYNGPNYNDIHKIWFNNLNLIRIESSLNEQGLPRLTFDRSDGNAMLKNVNVSETDVFIQLLEYKRNGGETIYTYQLDKKTFQVKDSFDDMGIIHQITDTFIFTSINHPFPKIVVYRR
jgi:hypothetical protein